MSGQQVTDHRGDQHRLSKPYEFHFVDNKTIIVWFNLSANVYWPPVKYDLESHESTPGPLLQYLLVPSPYRNQPVKNEKNKLVVELGNGETVPFSDDWIVITEENKIQQKPWKNR